MPREKHLPFFEMRDALRRPGCPICFFAADRTAKALEDLLYENITDVGFRTAFDADRGFCLRHTAQFLASRDGVAVGLTHRDLLKKSIQDLSAPLGRPGPEKDLRTKPCAICRTADETEKRHLQIIGDSIDEPDMREAFRQSDGFCLPHYQAFRRSARAAPAWLAEFQLRKYRELLSRLDHFLDHENKKPGPPPPPLGKKDKLVWEEAVKMLFTTDVQS